MNIVVDASAAMAAVLRSQSTGSALQFLARHRAETLVAPYIFYWEAVNVLVRLRRRGLLSARGHARAVEDIAELDIEVFDAPPVDEVLALGDQAMNMGLRPFDAAYLALAVQLDCPLASRDSALLAVAGRHVRCFDLQGDHLT